MADQPMQKPLQAIFFFSVVSIAGGILILHLPAAHPVVIFGSVFIAASIMYMAMAWTLFQVNVPAKVLFSIIAVALLVRLSFITASPIGSEDAYRYIWDGKVETSGTNPYLYTALDTRLNVLHSPLLPAAMNHADLKTIYFPLSEWIFYSCYQLSGEAIWGYKAIFLLAEDRNVRCSFFFSPPCSTCRGNLFCYTLYALSQFLNLPSMHTLMPSVCPSSSFALFFYLKEKNILSYVLLGLSMSIKPVGLIVLPPYSSWKKAGATNCMPWQSHWRR